MKEENEHYYEEDSENVLLDENQGASPYKWAFISIGVLSALAAVGIFYVFLKEAPPPVKIEKLKKSSVKPKKFVQPKPFKKETVVAKELPLLPKMPVIVPQIVPQKVYKQKLIKSGGGKLDISQSTSQNNKIIQKETINKNEIETPIKAYRGGISTVAGVHRYSANLSLARGTLIPCSMNTRLISMVSGQLTCTVSEDIYSVNGNVLLLEKGSMAVGFYKSEKLKNGMNRMLAIWDDIRTPNNVIVSVGSGAADELGSAGMVGEVDNHWGIRFGGAVLVSIIEDALTAGVNSVNKGNSINLNSSGSSVNKMGEEILKEYIDIPPTLYKNQGDLINIFVNKDIDFSQVYSLER